MKDGTILLRIGPLAPNKAESLNIFSVRPRFPDKVGGAPDVASHKDDGSEGKFPAKHKKKAKDAMLAYTGQRVAEAAESDRGCEGLM